MIFPEPNKNRFVAQNQSLMKTTAQYLFYKENKRQASDWDECYKWCRDKALPLGWTTVRQTKSRILFDYNPSVSASKEF